MKAQAHLYVSGRVQGVSCRWFVFDVAHTLNLSGWVRNLHDTRVESVFEGNHEVIEKAMLKCRQGPPAARVADIDLTRENGIESLADFEIRH
ncbi:MAG: acylphosphatase [Nitrospirae bacterium]|nr:acylphosphatase [Nitrospirota bacterium]